MSIDRNHEGYHDPTAGYAIRKAYRHRRGITKRYSLTYRIGESHSFQIAKEQWKGYQEST